LPPINFFDTISPQHPIRRYTDTSDMFRRVLLLASLVLLNVSLHGRAKPSPAADQDYIAALAVADNFLHAWQSHDEETGILLLSNQLRERSSADSVSTFFSTAHPEQAYEIGRGSKLAPGRYQFPVILWQRPAMNPSSGTAHHWSHPHTAMLVVIRTLKEDWLIDKIP
jgi:hypothetical protein